MNVFRQTRRQMLLDAGRAAATILFTASCRSLASEKTISQAAGSTGFKIGVCDWSLKKNADPAVFEAAKKIGFDGVQVSMFSVKNNIYLQKEDVRESFLEAAKKFRLEVASLAIGELNGIPYKSDARAEQWVAESIDVCKALGTNMVLIPFFGKGELRNDSAGVAVVVERLKRIAPKAEKAGVFLALESYLNAEQSLDIIGRVGSPSVKVYYDVANSTKAGYDIFKEIRTLGSEHICQFHAKDYKGMLGQGEIDFQKVRQAIDDIGYRGWIVAEPAKIPLGIEETCRKDLQYLREIFPPGV